MIGSIRNFETERTRSFRAIELGERDKITIAHIEEFGCEVIHVAGDSAGPGWSYTIGAYDTCNKPEIMTVGLPSKTAEYLGDSMSGDGQPVILCFHHPIDKDPSLKDLADLPLGWWAEHEKPGEPWVRSQHESDHFVRDPEESPLKD